MIFACLFGNKVFLEEWSLILILSLFTKQLIKDRIHRLRPSDISFAAQVEPIVPVKFWKNVAQIIGESVVHIQICHAVLIPVALEVYKLVKCVNTFCIFDLPG